MSQVKDANGNILNQPPKQIHAERYIDGPSCLVQDWFQLHPEDKAKAEAAADAPAPAAPVPVTSPELSELLKLAKELLSNPAVEKKLEEEGLIAEVPAETPAPVAEPTEAPAEHKE